jgi:hypothetical protein
LGIIEAEYRTGELSVRAIARRHGLSDTAVIKRAKAGVGASMMRFQDIQRRAIERVPALYLDDGGLLHEKRGRPRK